MSTILCEIDIETNILNEYTINSKITEECIINKNIIWKHSTGILKFSKNHYIYKPKKLLEKFSKNDFVFGPKIDTKKLPFVLKYHLQSIGDNTVSISIRKLVSIK